MFFPRSQETPQCLKNVIDSFKKVEEKQNCGARLTSNEMLGELCPFLQALGFSVETGKAAVQQIRVPVLFGENEAVEKSFAADAWSSDHKIVIEVEAGRAVFNNQFLKDIFEACMMREVEYLVIAVLNEYKFTVKNQEKSAQDYQTVKTFLETLYVSDRLQLPLKGILLIGY